MNDRKTFPSLLNIGLPSLLTIFVVLLLAVFATLSVATASSDYKLSQQAGKRTQQVYEAENKGEEFLKEIDELLIKSYNRENPPEAEVYQRIIEQAMRAASHEYRMDEGTLVITRDIPVNDSQTLHIEVQPNLLPKPGDFYYTIREWKITTITEWNKDDSLPLPNSSSHQN